jgi:hypothetical protein
MFFRMILYIHIYILWRSAWKPERRNGLAKHVSPTTFGSADNKRTAPVSIQRKRQHTSTIIGECNCYTTELLEAFPSQRKPYRTCSRYCRRLGYIKKKTFGSKALRSSQSAREVSSHLAVNEFLVSSSWVSMVLERLIIGCVLWQSCNCGNSV